MSSFSENLAFFMQQRLVSQSALARATGVSQAAISRYVKGLTLPAAADLYEISKFFEVSMDELWTGTPHPLEDSEQANEPTSAEKELAELKHSLRVVFRAMSEPGNSKE